MSHVFGKCIVCGMSTSLQQFFSFSSSESVVSYSGSDVFIFSNQIRTFYEGSKLSQMKQDIAKSRVKYGGTRFKGILPSDKTKIRKYFILSQISWANILKQTFSHFFENSYRPECETKAKN